MIGSSVNRDRFIVRLPRWDGLYPSLEEIQGAHVSAISNRYGNAAVLYWVRYKR
jgi:hypothetical protein